MAKMVKIVQFYKLEICTVVCVALSDFLTESFSFKVTLANPF